MPKMKTHRGAAKRFKVSANGKIRHKRAGKSHLLTGKTRSKKLHLKQTVNVHPSAATALKRLLPGQF